MEKPIAARDILNPAWSVSDVHGQYSDSNAHSDLYRFINLWTDMELYLNVGYTRFWQFHTSVKNHLRLIELLGDKLLAMHRAGPHAGERWLLDVGSGRGGAAIYARQKYGLAVLGIDITPYNLEIATQNARRYGLWPEVSFKPGDAHELPLNSASVSLAWSIESPAHFANKPAFLKEVYRVLKAGGAFTFCDLLAVEKVALASAENRQIYEQFLQVWDVPYLETFPSYRRALLQAGFEIRKTKIITAHNLDIYRRYCAIFLAIARIGWLNRYLERRVIRKIEADLYNIYQHVYRSYRALRLRMIDYGVFWVTKAAPE